MLYLYHNNHFLQLAEFLSPDLSLGMFKREFTLVTPSSAHHSSSSVFEMQSAMLLVDWHLSGSFSSFRVVAVVVPSM